MYTTRKSKPFRKSHKNNSEHMQQTKTHLLKRGPTLSRSEDSTCNHYVINITSWIKSTSAHM